jgi:hypothetical protein
LKIVQTPAAIALILCIVGATSASSPEDVTHEGTVKAGVAIFLVVYILLVLLTIGAALGRRWTGRGERKLLIAVAVSLPVLLIRMIYSLLSTFSNDKIFNPVNGSTTAELFLASIQEMIVVFIYIFVGFKLQPVPKTDGDEMTTKERLMRRAGRGDFGGGKLGLLSIAAAVGDEIRRDRKPVNPV